jgi:multiple sugar transport system permease protein
VLLAPHTGAFLVNSLFIAVPSVVGTVLLSSMAGFALAKHRFRGSALLLVMFVAGNLVPFQALMIPVRDLMLRLGLYDSRMALILFHTAFQTGFCTLFTRNFIRAVSLLAAAPPVALFWAMQRDLMAGLALSSARAPDTHP